MIMKVKKGTVERPPKPEVSNASDQDAPIASSAPKDLSKEDMIALLVNQGLDGDMDAVNACEDKIIRAKAKAMIMKVKKGTVERPPKPEIPTLDTSTDSVDPRDDSTIETENITEKVKKLLTENFPESLDDRSTDQYIQISPDLWYEIAEWLKKDPDLNFDSLQCQMGIDIGDDMLESRYNLHSMEYNHCIEVRISIPRANAKVPSVEKIWRIADWFERETYDMLGIEFTGHRDLRRILLPEDWEGWPLRKDYQVQETYHGIVVPKMKEGWE